MNRSGGFQAARAIQNAPENASSHEPTPPDITPAAGKILANQGLLAKPADMTPPDITPGDPTNKQCFPNNTMLSALLLAALIKLNLVIEKPMVPTAIFTVAAFIFGLLLEQPFLAVAIGAPINFGLSFLFFWLLKRTEGQGSWWVVVVGGILFFIGLSVGIRLIR